MKTSLLVISLGSNTPDGVCTITKAVEMLRIVFRSVTVTTTLRNPAVGMGKSSPDFHNALAMVRTTLNESEVKAICKAMETLAGNTPELRSQGIIVLDADIVTVDGEVRREKDYEREYFQKLLPELNIEEQQD